MMSMDTSAAFRLDGRRALVTGGSSGIGLAVAHEFLALGARVLLAARGEKRLADARSELLDAVPGATVETISTDLTSENDRHRLMEACGERLDILVNNTGTNIRKPMSEISLEEYRQVQEVNLVSAFDLSRLAYPLLKQSAPSCIVNNASVAGLCHLRTGPAYGISKAAMIQMTRNLAAEWAAEGIRVNAVAPWYIRTPLADQVLQDEDYRQDVLDRTPMGRVGDASECARAIAFLCMPAASYITGECLAVDGGFSIFGF